jgi:hypothetical protein
LREVNGASKPPAFAGWTHAFSLPVRAHGVQHDDGRIDDGATDAVLGAPGISVEGVDWENAISRETARRLIDLIIMAVDEVDGWSAR